MNFNITNNSKAIQGVWTDDGLIHVEAGKTAENVAVSGVYLDRAQSLPFLDVVDVLDHDGDGEAGGSNPAEPVSLSGKNKAELLAIAEAEGVEIEEGSTNADIGSAIELAREDTA